MNSNKILIQEKLMLLNHQLAYSICPELGIRFKYYWYGYKSLFRIIISVTLLLFISLQIQAQYTVKHDIQQIHDNYLQLGNVMVNIDYNMYASDSISDILETKRATVYKNKNYQVLDFMGHQTWYMQNHTIIIMPSDKKIVLGDPVSQMNSTSLAGISLDTLLQTYQVTQKNINGQIVYHFVIPESTNTPYSTMDIIAGDNGLFDKIILHSRFLLSYYGKCSECEDNFPRLEIIFDYVYNGFIMPDEKPLLAAIKKEDNQYFLSGKYSNYRLVNLKYKN